MELAVEIQKGYKYFGRSENDPNKNIVLNYINLRVEHNSIYGLLGASGCGKTTLLSCIVGRKRLNSGKMKVLGGEPGSQESGVPGPKLGYMPQGAGLMNELTVKEILYYFGRLQEMEDDQISERYKFITDLLELPDSKRLIDTYSGGQQRRISFAIAVIHAPELLILDEPTVGLDSLLREKIWNFLLDEVRTRKLAVIITTHYIDEAKQATKIGLMRGGVLLAEDSPSNIVLMYRTDTLEDAFLKMCLQQGSDQVTILSPDSTKSIESSHNGTIPIDTQTNIDSDDPERQDHKQQRYKLTTKRRMKAMLIRNYLQLIRQPSIVMLLFTIPILQGFNFYLAIGNTPQHLKVGVVNKEIPDLDFCKNESLVTVFSHDFECDMYKISCRFLNSISSNVAELIYFNDYQEAQEKLQRSRINGLIHFSSNFTEAFAETYASNNGADDGTLDANQIAVYLDTSHFMINFLLKAKLWNIYEEFTINLNTDCRYPKKLGLVPVSFMKPIYGSATPTYTRFALPGFSMTVIFFLSSIVTSLIFIDNRLSGIYDRIVVAGVNQFEILISHILINTVVVIIQCISFILLVVYYYQYNFEGNILHYLFVLILQGYGGLMYGLLISIVCDSVLLAAFVNAGTFIPMITLCGMVWPIEGMPKFLRYFVYPLPFTFPTIAIRDVIEKGYGIMHYTVLRGYATVVLVILTLLLCCIIALRIRGQ